jgi:ADP-ribosylglycohydrolase
MIDFPDYGLTLFEHLFGEGRLRLSRSPLFDTPAPHKSQAIDPDRVRGMMLGLAIGDALGNTSEGMNPAERRRHYGEIVGAAVGALHGEKALPARWRESLLGRTGADDDGRVQALLDAAVEHFV